MLESEEKLEAYLVKYIHHELTPEELSELEFMLHSNQADRDWFVKCLHLYKNHRQLEFLRMPERVEVWQKIGEKRKKLRRIFVQRLVACAAMVCLTLGLAFHFYLQNHSALEMLAENTLPAKKNVVLKLANGQQIVLGADQQVVTQDGRVITKDSSAYLSYNDTMIEEGVLEYNELIIPRGATYYLILADGTKVWLNSDSYLRYPVVFSKDCRDLELQGEAYFEVAKDKARPFTVKVGDNRVEVLGTHFNISAYQENDGIYTTLVEGSIKLKNTKNEKILIPGEQASILWDDKIIGVKTVDANLYTSWRNGVYEFRNTPLSEIAENLMRWYDIKFLFKSESTKNKCFTGAFKRDDSLNLTIENLQKISNLKFLQGGDYWIVEE